MPRNANDVSAARSIAADWGSSQLRLYLCAGDGQVLDQYGLRWLIGYEPTS